MEKKNTDIDLSQERIRHLHSVCTASPGSGDANSVLCGVRLVIRRRHVRRVEHEDVDRSSEATRQRTREGRDERFDWGLCFYLFIFVFFLEGEGGDGGCCTLFWDAVRAVHVAACGLMSVQRKTCGPGGCGCEESGVCYFCCT
jgi:hypothetical protein